MEVLLNKLFDKHSEGYGVYDRENLIKDICKELKNLQLQQTGVVRSNLIDESPEPRINVHIFNESDYHDGKFLK
jgi:hypothetical protein